MGLRLVPSGHWTLGKAVEDMSPGTFPITLPHSRNPQDRSKQCRETREWKMAHVLYCTPRYGTTLNWYSEMFETEVAGPTTKRTTLK